MPSRIIASGLLLIALAAIGDARPACAQEPPAATPATPAAPAAATAPAVAARPAVAAAPASADTPETSLASLIGRPVSSVHLERLGQPLTDARITALVETRAGAPLSMREVRNTLLHLFNTGLFDDIAVSAAPDPAPDAEARDTQAIALVYTLTPARTIGRYEFRGVRGVSDESLRRLLVDRFGARPAVGRVQEAPNALEAFYRDAGFINAHVTSTVEPAPAADSAALILTVASGPRARIGTIDVRGSLVDTKEAFLDRLGLKPGDEFDGTAFPKRVERVVQDMRNRGYYEATVTPLRTVRDDGRTVDLAVDVVSGPRVTLKFEGGGIPTARQEELVPVRREGSIDEDLLEDSKRRIEDFLHRGGHWKAAVSYARQPAQTELDLVFTVREGPVFRVAEVQIAGNDSMPRTEVDTAFTVHTGDLFVESDVDARTAAIVERYRRLGFRQVKIDQVLAERNTPPPSIKPTDASATAAAAKRDTSLKTDAAAKAQAASKVDAGGKTDTAAGWVDVRLTITEGPRTRVGSLALGGQQAIEGATLRAAMTLKPGEPFFEPQIAADRDAMETQYLNRGFERVAIEEVTTFSPDGATADLAYTIHEGTQLFIDHIVIVGNHRTDTDTIERALTIARGKPLSLSDLFESQRRLSALGLFRRVRLTDVGEPGESRRDVIVTVEEAPTTTLGYGAGLEAGRRIKSSGSDVNGPQEALEFAGRGFLEVGRRNLFGSNRSATVFLRGSLRPRDQPNTPNSDFGINEYRVLSTLRDPGVMGTTIDGQIAGYFEQAIRSSFNFRRRGIQAQATKRLPDRWTLSGTYSFNHTELFDEQIDPSEQLDIDRLFPQVRLSVFSVASRRDTRDDALDPTRGTVIGLDSDIAARSVGSEVGFLKGFGEVFWYRQVPAVRNAVFASGARMGLARGFARVAPRLSETGSTVIGPDGQPVLDTVTDLPASERFFAGGDTTVRGFARDTLGDLPTLDSRGFPQGGNALVIFNAEMRVPVWHDFGSVFFVDAGNIFSRVDEIDFTRLRPTAGFGVRYKSPVGPIRVDIGFKLDRSRFASIGRREPLSEVHISIGQAF
jgi:outer membrane protein insertion porin family